MSKELMNIYNNSIALRDTMKFAQESAPKNSLYGFVGYEVFAKKYTILARKAAEHFDISNLDFYDQGNLPTYDRDDYLAHKRYFDSIYTNLGQLISSLENNLDIKQSEVQKIKDFLENNLRKAIHDRPKGEKDIQSAIEILLIGRGYSKGVDYDRETGRIKISSKEVIPDFIFKKIGLALEIKFSTTKQKSKQIIDEINADIRSYSKEYFNLLFLVYDVGIIQDESEFKNDIDNKTNIQVIIVKH